MQDVSGPLKNGGFKIPVAKLSVLCDFSKTARTVFGFWY